jgi:hypothetical protein
LGAAVIEDLPTSQSTKEGTMRLGRSAAAFACVSAIAGGVLGSAANAAPSNGKTLTYFFHDCGSVQDFYAVKQPSEAAALHLLDGSGTFVAMKAVVLGDQTVGGTFYADGTVLFATPGFSEGKNNLPTITCTNLSATSGILARVTGYIAPTK